MTASIAHDVELARKLSLLASHALAARYASQSEIEKTQLRDLTAQGFLFSKPLFLEALMSPG
jgi:hypothetical protein